MSELRFNAFDAWLWSADDVALRDVQLRDLASRAATEGVRLPQLTF